MNKTELTLVTGSANKLASWRRIVDSSPFTLHAVNLNQVEIQPEDPMDALAIVVDKAQRAFERLQKPVVVEDVSAGLDSLGGFPGPYIKAAETTIGETALWVLANQVEAEAYVSCAAAYFDGSALFTAVGTQHGRVVAPRMVGGWGFDVCFQPHGYDLTLAEMSPAQKDGVGYRAEAIVKLLEQLADRT